MSSTTIATNLTTVATAWFTALLEAFTTLATNTYVIYGTLAALVILAAVAVVKRLARGGTKKIA